MSGRQSPKDISTRTLQGLPVLIMKNSYPRGESRRYRLVTLEKLLTDSVQVLGLTSNARKVFTQDGKLVSDIGTIPEHATLLISCGEPFNQGMPTKKPKARRSESPTLPPPSQAQEEELKLKEESVTSQTDLRSQQQSAMFQSVQFLFDENKNGQDLLTRSLSGSITPPPPKVDKETKKLIQTSTRSIDEELRDSSLAVYASLTKEEKLEVENTQAVNNLYRTTQFNYFTASLMNQMIYNHLQDDDVRNLVVKWCNDKLEDYEPITTKILLTGPKKSGKTSVLYTFASQLYQKVQVDEELSDKILFFPINFETFQNQAQTAELYYTAFVKKTFESVKHCCFSINPMCDSLENYFLTLPRLTSIPKLPPGIAEYTNISTKSLKSMAANILEIFSKKGKNNAFTYAFDAIVQFPRLIAKAIGLQDVFFIIDHIDLIDCDIQPTSAYSSSFKPVNLLNLIIEEISKSPFLIGIRNDSNMVSKLSPLHPLLRDMAKFFTVQEPRVIRSLEPAFKFTSNDCMGCPAYLSLFNDLFTSINRMKSKSPSKSKYDELKPTITTSRYKIIISKLISFCQVVDPEHNDITTPELMNQIQEASKIHFRLNHLREKRSTSSSSNRENTKKVGFANQ